MKNIIKSVLFTLEMIAIGVGAAFVFLYVGNVFNIPPFKSFWMIAAGVLFACAGIALRLWASLSFYRARLNVFGVHPQHTLTRNGPYRFSRNPSYVGTVMIFFGIMFAAGSFLGTLFSVFVFLFWDIYIRLFEEKHLEKLFGGEYLRYKKEVPRWL